MIDINELKTLYIGKQGENEASIAVFDISSWIEEYGAGTAKLLHKRSKDELPYIAQTTQSGSTLSWIFTKDDTAYSGYGKAQLNYYVDDKLAKTLIFTTKCDKSLTDETETPKEVKSALDLIAGTVDSKLSASNIIAGDNVTIDVDGNDVTINSTGGGSGTGDYDDLDNKPSINSVELSGNKSLSELGIQPSGDYATASEMSAEENARQNADSNLQGQIDAITVSSDVIDVVGTYAELLAYDTAHVKANDIIKVLQDSTHSNALSYYRWVISSNVGAWAYVGSEGPFYTKSETDSILTDYATISDLADKADAFTVGKGLSIDNDVLTADVRRWLFVSSLPSTNIDLDAIYLMLNSKMFPSVFSLVGTVEGEQQKAAVTYDEGIGYKFVRFNTKTNRFYGTGGAIAFEWELFTTDGVTWTKVDESAEGGDTAWTTAMGWTSSSTGAAYTNVLWANSTFQYIGAYTHWNPDNNTARIDGTAIDTSTLPPYEYMASQYDGTAWQDLGVFDFAVLFNKVETAIASKADSATTYTKTEVDTALASKQNTLTFDSTPTENSTNPVTSGGLYNVIGDVETLLASI